jgi:hypothetical protein
MPENDKKSNVMYYNNKRFIFNGLYFALFAAVSGTWSGMQKK